MADNVPQPDIIDARDGADEIEQSRAPLMEHLIELRARLMIIVGALAAAFVLCFLVSAPLYNWLTLPFVNAVTAAGQETAVLNYAPLELFFSRIKLSFFAALMASFPITAWQIYAFVAPGLYKSEKRAVLPFLFAMPVLFAMGIALVHVMVLPMVLDFALGIEAGTEAGAPANYNLFVKVGEYLSLAIALMVGFGFAFQLPVVLMLLGQAGLISAEFLSRNRRYAIVIIFLVAAFLTPPDPMSQIALGGTILVLYELSIWGVRWTQRKRGPVAPETSAG
ncbi:twin-arginine translocase subunit TatC [Parvularcula lutaonensis]|uniref:Sec-independent protein translocase protein TatC n=1 Tax=Parvularcula lutaonensis TaxID=491923 RepID=A0ABV7MB22_9PROT|nr:twin-arginine translocase subunit TatC [Parvularcula lutaonensis]GGY39407.1 Sec-independent protein translocase protein TatC [Parvularcula lutaonensis]